MALLVDIEFRGTLTLPPSWARTRQNLDLGYPTVLGTTLCRSCCENTRESRWGVVSDARFLYGVTGRRAGERTSTVLRISFPRTYTSYHVDRVTSSLYFKVNSSRFLPVVVFCSPTLIHSVVDVSGNHKSQLGPETEV